MRGNREGFTLVEVVIAMAVLAIAMLSIATAISFMSKQGERVRNKAFATQKVIQMVEELRGLISNTNSSSIGILDNYSDGTSCNYVLTTNKSITNPGDPTSGNSGQFYCRQISVTSVPNDLYSRRVYVRLYVASPRELLVETMSVLRTVASNFVPTQVFDVYILSLENVPGWWVALSQMKQTLDAIIQDLQNRNPGLELRTHWITRLAYGRDPYYTPYVNTTTYTNSTAPPRVYFYPGLMKDSSNLDYKYFDSNNFAGRINVDGTVISSSSYSTADQYNNAVRYPDEVTLYNQAVAAAQSAGQAPPEVSLRMLLERMNSQPNLSTNLLLINLHGELLPLPPMRNYSDAARVSPNWNSISGTEKWRAVTHPEQLQYPSGSFVKLRVYSHASSPGAVPDGTVIPSLTVYLPTVGLNSSNVSVRVATGSSTSDYSWKDATSGVDYTFSSGGGTTLITLNNSPLRHPYNASTFKGLDSSQQLYGLEYIPCPVGSDGFGEWTSGSTYNDLTTNDPVTRVPKNTARWMIEIATGILSNGSYPIETRLGTDYTTGISTNQPTNLSRTYVWVGAAPPTTEQYQFLGDPRHMPYADVKSSNGYNWYFTQILGSAGGYSGYVKTANGWNGNGGQVNYDVPRFFQMYRQGLLNTIGLWTTMTGFSFYYTGIGGEFGADASNGFPNGLQIIETPWNPSGSGVAKVDEITSNNYGLGTQNSVRLITKVDNSWFSLPWIGELYNDGDFTYWSANGNLQTGPSNSNYYRANYTTFASTFSYNPVKRTSEKGCASFVNGNPNQDNTSTYYNHGYASGGTGNITTQGNYVAQTFNFPLPGTINATRPMTLAYTGATRQPPEWIDATYSAPAQRTATSMMEAYFNSSFGSTYKSSELVKVQFSTSAAAYLVTNGVSNAANFGSSSIGKLTTINMIRGYMSAGLPTTSTVRIPQLPLISVSTPTSGATYGTPSSIMVVWSSTWTRWDGNAYTTSYPAGFSESTPLTINVKYSVDNGRTWFFVQDNASAQVGVKDTLSAHAATSPLTWDVSNAALFPQGNYTLRVEEFRTNLPLHYTYHQRQIYITR